MGLINLINIRTYTLGMVDVLALSGVVTMSVSHPYYFGRYKFMVSNVNLVKDINCSDSDVLTYASVKYYSVCASAIFRTPICSYICMKALFPTQAGIFLNTHSIAYIP